MGVLDIRKYPDPVLRKRAKEVRSVGKDEKKLLAYMADTMYASQGIGLAAPQIGVSKRLIVVDTGEGLLKMANPEIVGAKGASMFEEGCLSVPEVSIEVKRALQITVSYVDESNTRQMKVLDGINARAVQHEIDHLNGRLILDYLPWYKRVLPKRGEVKCLQ